MRPSRLATLLLLLLGLAFGRAEAQYVQYAPPGALPFGELPTLDRLERAHREARWRLGPVRLDPWFGLKDTGWVDNVFGRVGGNTTSDLTATVGAGLRGYARLGDGVVGAVHALPEYVWWRELDQRRVWNGRYGAGAFGDLNRFRFRLTATTAREAQYLSSEVEQLVNVRADRLEGSFAVALSGKTTAFVEGSTEQFRYREQDVSGPLGGLLLELDRDQDRLRAGLRYSPKPGISLGVGLEDVSVDFVRPGRDRSSSGTSPVLELEYRRGRVDARLFVLLADLEPEPGSEFVPFDDALRQMQIRWRPGSRLMLELYGRENLVYSFFEGSPYYVDRRLGVAAAMPFGHRFRARVFLEDGVNDYRGSAVTDQDATSVGSQMSFELGRDVAFNASVWRTSYSYEGFGERSITNLRVGLTIGGGAGRWY